MSKLLEQINNTERQTKKIGDVFDIIDGDRGTNYPSKSEFTKTGYCVFLNTKNVPSQGFDFSNVDFVSKERDELLRKGKLSRNDIVMTTRGTIGNVALYSNNIPFDCMRINSGMVVLRSKDEYDRIYLYTLIKSDVFNTRLKNTSSGSAQPQLPIKDLKEIELEIPDLSTQNKIASILSAYDAKIENNNKIIKNLEATAQTIFNEWFVEFHFPGYEKVKMVDSEMGEIPEGWEVGKIDDFGNVVCGKTPSKSNDEYFGGNIPFIKIPDMHGQMFILNTEDSLTEGGANTQVSKLLPEGSICVSCIATVGLVSITTKDSQTNQQINTVVPENKKTTEYLYFILTKMKADLQAIGSGGSTTLNVNTSVFSNIEVIIPEKNILEDFHTLVIPMFDGVKQMINENISLKSQRDQLLAKLI